MLFKRVLIVSMLLAMSCRQGPPLRVVEGLFDSERLDEVPGAETFVVFRAEEEGPHYANGAVLTVFKGRFYCMWQASERDEDSPDTRLVYAVSADGERWSRPMELAGPGTTSGGWWKAGDSLVAYVNVWPESTVPRGGEAWYRTSGDGVVWAPMRPVRMADGSPMRGILEQDSCPSENRIIGAAHFQPGLQVCPIYTDSPDGVTGWYKADFPATPHQTQTRELEPGVFARKGELVMVFRDQASSFHKLASVSRDNGKTWTKAVETDFPDSRSKQCAGNLPDGTAFLIGNPTGAKDRSVLTIATAKDGSTFDRAWLIGRHPAPGRYEGKAKTPGFSYPKAIVHGEYLYVAYSINKEDIAVTRIPLAGVEPIPRTAR